MPYNIVYEWHHEKTCHNSIVYELHHEKKMPFNIVYESHYEKVFYITRYMGHLKRLSLQL